MNATSGIQLLVVISFLCFMEIYCCHCQEWNASFPLDLHPSVILKNGTQRCPAQRDANRQIHWMKLKIQHELLPHANRFLTEQHGPPCTCGGRREWIRIAHLNMRDPTQTCPSNWTLKSSPVRGCGKSTTRSCDSAFYSSNG